MSASPVPAVLTDVGKENVDVHITPSGKARQFRNDTGGRRGLRKLLHRAGVELVVIEATSRYHRELHQGLHDASLRVAVIGPLQARRFAQALGQLAKTDPIDAAMLARFGQVMDPDATVPRSGAQFRLNDLARGRAQLIRIRTSLLNASKEYKAPEAAEAIQRTIDNINREIYRLEEAVRAAIADDPDRARRDQILRSVPGTVRAATKSCAPSPASGRSAPPYSAPKCQNSEPSADARPPPSSGSPRSPTTAEREPGSVTSEEDASCLETPCTWLR